MNIDEISPSTIGEDRIRITLADPNQALRAFTAVQLAVSYARCVPEGVVLPLEFTVTNGRNEIVARTLFARVLPTTLTFTPREGGSYLVRLAELFHNQWWGRLVLEITGDRFRS